MANLLQLARMIKSKIQLRNLLGHRSLMACFTICFLVQFCRLMGRLCVVYVLPLARRTYFHLNLLSERHVLSLHWRSCIRLTNKSAINLQNQLWRPPTAQPLSAATVRVLRSPIILASPTSLEAAGTNCINEKNSHWYWKSPFFYSYLPHVTTWSSTVISNYLRKY